MSERRGYIGIDRFRVVAALLVVAIHTSPLLSLGALPDYFFTRVLARMGVPFFLGVTGFFLLAPFAGEPRADARPVLRFAKKTALLYAAAILLYLPVNIYAGHWNGVRTLGQALKMLLVDGTLYHLWYLPAAIFGVLLTWGLLRLLGLRAATGVAAALYVLGLLGDSYYGIAAALPPLRTFYGWVLTFGTYTRNGLFYAPLFLLVGVWAAKHPARTRPKAAAWLCVSLLLLLAEGAVLRAAGGARHDSMYLLLPVCLFFLLAWLAAFQGPAAKVYRSLSLLVYLLHPWVIVLLRGGAKLLGAEGLLVDNSLVHYLAVCALSFGAAGVFIWLKNRLLRPGAPAPKRAWVEVDLDALAHNVRLLKGMLPDDCRLMPALKANAYGLEAAPIARALRRLGVRDYCVASLSEGIALRRQGVRGQILVLGYTHPDDCPLLRRYRLTQTVVDAAHGQALARQGIHLPVHLKVDTGMRRLGQRSEQVEQLCPLFSLEHLDIRGVFTQLSGCDSTEPEDIAFTHRQLENFEDALAEIERRGLPVPARHVQCSYGILNYPGIEADYARPGLALYGIVDEAYCIGPVPPLRPIFEVKTRVALVKPVHTGERIGYGSAYPARRDRQIAVIPMGYADGLPRCLSGGVGRVLVHGEHAPIVGNICMDQAMIDVSGIENVQAGDTVCVIGRCEGAEITVNEFAARAGSIPNEIVSRLGARLERVYSGGRAQGGK